MLTDLDTTSPHLNLTAVALVLLVTLALALGDVVGRKAVTMLDVLMIAPVFIVIGACTPLGQAVASALGTIRVR